MVNVVDHKHNALFNSSCISVILVLLYFCSVCCRNMAIAFLVTFSFSATLVFIVSLEISSIWIKASLWQDADSGTEHEAWSDKYKVQQPSRQCMYPRFLQFEKIESGRPSHWLIFSILKKKGLNPKLGEAATAWGAKPWMGKKHMTASHIHT